MTTATRIVELAGGIRATLVHQPQVTRAAALVKVGAGSHHETDALPGLGPFTGTFAVSRQPALSRRRAINGVDPTPGRQRQRHHPCPPQRLFLRGRRQ